MKLKIIGRKKKKKKFNIFCGIKRIPYKVR